MRKYPTKFESWQFFHVSRQVLGSARMWEIYRKSARYVQQWAANPKYCEVIRRNPLDRIRDMLQDLELHGHGEWACAAVDYLCEPLGGHFSKQCDAVSDKGCVDGEATDCLTSLGALVVEIRNALADGRIETEERVRIADLTRSLRREVDELLDAVEKQSECEVR